MQDSNYNNSQGEIQISIKDLYKSFGDNHVLEGANLEVHNKENVVVLGRSGTGKSVLIKIVCGLLKPDNGIVNVLGKDVPRLNDSELQKFRLQI
jgi:phospholipid/cholesterol/gamma-HCH transport system ATP-binding protein